MRDMMPLNPILEVENFNVWDIVFMGPFPSSFGNQYTLVCGGLCFEIGGGYANQDK